MVNLDTDYENYKALMKKCWKSRSNEELKTAKSYVDKGYPIFIGTPEAAACFADRWTGYG